MCPAALISVREVHMCPAALISVREVHMCPAALISVREVHMCPAALISVREFIDGLIYHFYIETSEGNVYSASRTTELKFILVCHVYMTNLFSTGRRYSTYQVQSKFPM